MKPYYYIRLYREFDNAPKAAEIAERLSSEFEMNFQVGYHMPQPIYKSWIPNWFIRFITKKQ